MLNNLKPIKLKDTIIHALIGHESAELMREPLVIRAFNVLTRGALFMLWTVPVYITLKLQEISTIHFVGSQNSVSESAKHKNHTSVLPNMGVINRWLIFILPKYINVHFVGFKCSCQVFDQQSRLFRSFYRFNNYIFSTIRVQFPSVINFYWVRHWYKSKTELGLRHCLGVSHFLPLSNLRKLDLYALVVGGF